MGRIRVLSLAACLSSWVIVGCGGSTPSKTSSLDSNAAVVASTQPPHVSNKATVELGKTTIITTQGPIPGPPHNVIMGGVRPHIIITEGEEHELLGIQLD